MCNNTRPDAAAEAIRTLMHALIDIDCSAELAEKHGNAEYKNHAIGCIRDIAARSLDKAKTILIADCNNGGVMCDDRFNSLKREFDGAPEDTADALLCINDLIKAAYFLIHTANYFSDGTDILNIASDYAEYVAKAHYRRKLSEVVSHE